MNNTNIKYYFFRPDRYWNTIPFVKFLIPYCIGIVFYKNLVITPIYTIFSLLFITFFILSIETIKIKQGAINQHISVNLKLFISIIIIGYCNSYFEERSFIEGYKRIEESDPKYFKGVISDESGNKKRNSYTLTVQKIKSASQWIPARGEILLKCENCDSIRIGSEWVVKARIKEILPPEENYLPNYAAYYYNKGIYHQQFLHQIDIVYTGEDLPGIMTYANRINRKLKTILFQYLEESNFSIANALILGNKSHLSREMKSTYAQSGIMHILAVSGLHVGIVFLLLKYSLGFLRRSKSGKVVFFILSALILWAFAFITGLSTSVTRAASMFTLFLASDLINRRNYSINAAAFTAIAILIFNPHALFDISFQLSFAAVFSILLFYHSFYNLYQARTKVLRYAWQITCLSLSVQVLTLPISVFYFNHFQPYFILYNLLAIPFAFCVLLLGIALLVSSPISLIAGWIGKLLNLIISSFNQIIIKLIEFFPDSAYIKINDYEIFILWVIAIALFGIVYRKKWRYMIVFTVIFFSFMTLQGYKDYLNIHQKGLKISSQPSPSCIIYSGNSFYEFSLTKDSYKDYNISSFLDFSGIHIQKDSLFQFEDKNIRIVVSQNKSVAILKNSIATLPDGFHVDYLLLPDSVSSFAKKYYAEFTDHLVD